MLILAIATLHILVIALTNFTVQFPFILFGLHSTWGIFTYPLIFIITDLTVRLIGPRTARQVIQFAMLPSLFISYILANLSYHQPTDSSWLAWNPLAFRVAMASLSAYVFGQLLDIKVFQKLRQHQKWWVAPTVSSFFGNTFDTLLFFFVAFYHSSNPFFAQHWVEIATVDLGFKLFISFASMIPLYGALLRQFTSLTKTECAGIR